VKPRGAVVQKIGVRIFVVAIGLVVIASACSSDSTPPDVDPNQTYEVVYQVLGDMDRTEITYTYNGGNDIFRGEVDLPWRETFQMKAGDLIDLGARTDGSTVTCRVLIDRVKYRESTETGGNFPVCQGVVAPR
jgi:hypothetical protein